MAKIALFNIPFSGHINPTLQLASQLVERGHHLDYWATAAMAKKIQPTGARLRTYPDSVHFPTGAENLFALTSQLATAAEQLYPWLLAELEQHPLDIILTDSSTVWGQYLGLELDIPVVTLFPNFVVTQQVLTNSPKTILKTLHDAARYLPDTIRAVTTSYHVSTNLHPYQVGSPMDVLSSTSTTNIVFTSKDFQPYGVSFDDSFHFVGPQIASRANKVTQKRVDQQQIYISLGTLYNNNRRFYTNCVHALIDSQHHVTISTGSTEMTQYLQGLVLELQAKNQSTTSTFTIADRVDQLAVLASCDLFITHGGMNSVSESIAAQVPMLVVPQTIEQSINAARVEQLELGKYEHNLFASAQKITAAVRKILSNSTAFQKPLSQLSDNFRTGQKEISAVKIIEQKIAATNNQQPPKIMLIHGYGTNIESAFAKPRGKSAGFYAFSDLLIRGQAELFRWDVPFRPQFPDTINPFALLNMYKQEQKELTNPSLFKRLDQTIHQHKTESIITNSMGGELLITYLKDHPLPPSVKRIITIQSDMQQRFELDSSVKKRLENNTLIWENYWCWWDQALFASGFLNRSGRAGVSGTRVKGIKNKFYPLIRNGNLHISSIIDPEFVKRLKL